MISFYEDIKNKINAIFGNEFYVDFYPNDNFKNNNPCVAYVWVTQSRPYRRTIDKDNKEVSICYFVNGEIVLKYNEGCLFNGNTPVSFFEAKKIIMPNVFHNFNIEITEYDKKTATAKFWGFFYEKQDKICINNNTIKEISWL